MNAPSIAIRSIHFVSVMVLFGEFLFFIWIAVPAFRVMPDMELKQWYVVRCRMLRISGWSLVAIFVSGILWLAMEAISMSGFGVERALKPEVLGAVLNATRFGLVWKIRLGLAIALFALLVAARGRPDHRSWMILAVSGLSLAGILLATLAWTGHAAGERGIDHVVHSVADAIHLLAAGAWFGTLFPFVLTLAHAVQAPSRENDRFAAYSTRRFSTLGVASMALLVLAGMINTRYTVGSVDALFVTRYGHLLLAKLLLFGAILVLAAMNRVRLTPQLVIADYSPTVSLAMRRLYRNSIIELALGLVIVAIVGALGIMVPAVHAQHLHDQPEMLHRH
jgi:putative copper resistance protein D